MKHQADEDSQDYMRINAAVHRATDDRTERGSEPETGTADDAQAVTR
jgi:hypothetical protein